MLDVCFPRVRKVSCWQRIDIEHVLNLDDNLFKYLGFHRCLDASDLPHQIVLEGFNFSITKLNFHDGEATISSKRYLLNSFRNRQLALLFMNCSYCYSNHRICSGLNLFDSCSRNRLGLGDSDSYLVLLMFWRLKHVQNYIEVIHLEYHGLESQYTFS